MKEKIVITYRYSSAKQHSAMRRIAKKNKRSVQKEIEIALDNHIENNAKV